MAEEQELTVRIRAEDDASPALERLKVAANQIGGRFERFIGGFAPAEQRQVTEQILSSTTALKQAAEYTGLTTDEVKMQARAYLGLQRSAEAVAEHSKGTARAAERTARPMMTMDRLTRTIERKIYRMAASFILIAGAVRALRAFKEFGWDVAVATEKSQQMARSWHGLMQSAKSFAQSVGEAAVKTMEPAVGWLERRAMAMRAAEAEATRKVGKPPEDFLIGRWPSLEEMRQQRRWGKEYARQYRYFMEHLEEAREVAKPPEEVAAKKIAWSAEQVKFLSAAAERGVGSWERTAEAAGKLVEHIREAKRLELKGTPRREWTEEVYKLARAEQEAAAQLEKFKAMAAGGAELGRLEKYAAVLGFKEEIPGLGRRARQEHIAVLERQIPILERLLATVREGSDAWFDYAQKLARVRAESAALQAETKDIVREAFGITREELGRAGVGGGIPGYATPIAAPPRAPQMHLTPGGGQVSRIEVDIKGLTEAGKQALFRDMTMWMGRQCRAGA